MFLILNVIILILLHHRSLVFPTLSSRTERSVVKDLVYIYLFPLLCVSEILRFALDDKEICVICGEPNYSSLNASAGSTFAARTTGMAVPIKDMIRSSR